MSEADLESPKYTISHQKNDVDKKARIRYLDSLWSWEIQALICRAAAAEAIHESSISLDLE